MCAEPMCILTTDRQLDEMSRSCTSSSNFVTVGVDPTFKLGSFYVTPMVFPLHMLFSKQTGNSPIYCINTSDFVIFSVPLLCISNCWS